jgi:hypothetical protein
MAMYRVGTRGAEVEEIHKLLGLRGYGSESGDEFTAETEKSVRAFQSQNLDPRGVPLVVDGVVGPLTEWSLRHPKPTGIEGYFSYTTMPASGGSRIGRAALEQAIGQIQAGACEQGGNNCGPFVTRYLAGHGHAGDSWCAAFVSYCFQEAAKENHSAMPFQYSLSARDILRQFDDKKLASNVLGTRLPDPGDLVVWWRGAPNGWKGHIGLVHSVQDGVLYTIEGNRSPRVQGFSYVLSRMEKLLGYCQVQ